jgi:RHS repeat-associated protein
MSYWRSFSGQAIAETDGTSSTTDSNYNEYVFFAGRRIAQSNPYSNAQYYYFVDHLGSTRAVTNATGTTCFEMDYLPYGTENPPAGFIGSCSNPPPFRYLFTGYERDVETAYGTSAGSDYAFARFYNSRLGRFMSGDPLDGDITDPQTLNRYAYTRGNPLNAADPTGMGTCYLDTGDEYPCPDPIAPPMVVTPDPFDGGGGTLTEGGGGGGSGMSYSYAYIPASWVKPPPPKSAPSKTGCFVKGVVAGATTTLVVGAVAIVAAPVVGATAVTVGLGVLAVAGAASLGWTASHDISSHNWAGVSYDAGSLVGSLATGIAGGPRVATAIDPNATPGWSPQSWSAQAYDPSKGSLGSWMGSGPTHASAGVSTGAGGWLSSLFGAGCH